MFVYKFSVVLLFTFNTASSLPIPDFQHKIDHIEMERKDVEHGLGEIPLLVDVQVQPVDGYYSSFYFPGVGTSTRDDDEPFDYGCVIYSYNDTYIMISTPIKNNGHLGAALFLQNSSFWDGQSVNYSSFGATVHIRAWRATALPSPDFVYTGTYMKANGLHNETYVEKPHHLGEYPGLVIVRLVSPNNNLILNAVGATFSTFTDLYSMNSYVVYGYDNSNIRIWTMGSEFGEKDVYYYARGDGNEFRHMPKLTGTLEIYAWTISSLPPTFTTEISLGINGNVFTPETQLPVFYDLHASLVKVTVQSLSGINKGYMFEGTGSMAYSDVHSPTSCRYGGLVYGYNESSITMWKPTDTYSGTLICISDMLAEGFNTQASHDGKAFLNSWLIRDECKSIRSGGADIVFVVDTSTSQSGDNVERQKRYIQSLITDIMDNKNTFQFSLVTVSFTPVIQFYFNTHNNKELLLEAVNSFSFERGPSYLGKSLQLVHNEVLKASNGARFVNTYIFNTYVVIFSDGLSSDREDTIARAKNLKQDGVIVISIGIGPQIHHRELLDIASDSTDFRVLSARNNDLTHYFRRYRVSDQCLDCVKGSSDVVVLMDASSNLDIHHFYKQLDALRQLVKVLPIGNDNVRLSYGKFADNVYMEFNFTEHISSSDVIVAISTPSRLTQYQSAGDISSAIEFVTTHGFIYRKNARKFVVIFTNGKTEYPNDIEEKALKLKANGVLIATVGIGLDSNLTLLSRIATEPVFAFIIGDDVNINTNVLTSLLGSFLFNYCHSNNVND